jgi:hypothetical protein
VNRPRSQIDFIGELDIRRALTTHISKGLSGRRATIVSELSLRIGPARADLVLLDDDIKAFEIKSDFDSLDRLPGQIQSYNRVFDEVTLICGSVHLHDASIMIPEWWGLMLGFRSMSGQIELAIVRPPRPNPTPDNYALAQLLWREEIVASISSHFSRERPIRGSRQVICRELADRADRDLLKSIVVTSLISRQAVLSVAQPQ